MIISLKTYDVVSIANVLISDMIVTNDADPTKHFRIHNRPRNFRLVVRNLVSFKFNPKLMKYMAIILDFDELPEISSAMSRVTLSMTRTRWRKWERVLM